MATDQITIAEETFNVPIRYAAGHELTENEAGALNQTFHENLRNNFAKKVKDAKETGAFDLAALQASLDDYAEAYEFGAGGGGGGPRDPVKSEAMSIAREAIKAHIRKGGKKVSDYKPAQINEAAKKLLSGEKGEQIMSMARERVEAQKAVTEDALGGVEI